MSLIIRQLRRKSDYRPVSFNDFPSDSLEWVDSTDKVVIYTVEPGSKPIPENKVYSEDVYNDDVDSAPIDVFVNDDGDVDKDRREVAEQIFDTYGEGKYNVFIFGGAPCYESVFDKPVVIKDNRGEA